MGEGRERGGEGEEWGGGVVVVVVRTGCSACMSVHTRTRLQLIKKMDQCQCTGPFGWTDQPETHYACSLRRQVPGVPSANLAQPQVEEKDCEARPPHPPLLRRKGGAIFSTSSALDALDREDMRRYTWTCLLGKLDPFLPKLPPGSERRPGVTNCRLPPPFPTQGKDQKGKRVVKIVVP